MKSFRTGCLLILSLLALTLPACDFVVDAFKTGTEDYIIATTTAVLEALLPFDQSVTPVIPVVPVTGGG